MGPTYGSKSFGKDNREILGETYDAESGANITILCYPESTIGSSGPVFESIDSKTVYVLISEEYVANATITATDDKSVHLQYGMMLGDIMRRGSYYVQNINNNNKNKNK